MGALADRKKINCRLTREKLWITWFVPKNIWTQEGVVAGVCGRGDAGVEAPQDQDEAKEMAEHKI